MWSSKEHSLVLGKVDYNGSGRKNCNAVITWELKDGRFSMCAEIWNHIGTDIYCGGQCVDKVAAYFPHNKKAQRMLSIWKQWHLNDLTAGSPRQEAFLKANPVTAVYPESHYVKASEALKAAGLNPDSECIHNGKPYSYGSAWLKTELPPEVIAEIESWSAPVEAIA